ncbi:MAG TPA: DUF2339 domain-containing protein [Terriglobales bacterium]|nr:DUF2339 domain-containing protein [Terriglobales bacterium]
MDVGRTPGDGESRRLQQLEAEVHDLSRRLDRLEKLSAPGSAAVGREAQQSRRAAFEARVGSQYLNRAGIIALLIGIAFAVHWAFSNNLLGAAAVLALGLTGGLAIIFVGQRFIRRGYSAFGLSLEALGIAALYVVLWAGFEVYRVFGAAVAFAGMVAITAATAASAIAQRSELLAIFAFLGGFATPLLLAADHGREFALLIYLLVVTCGMALTAAYRRWSNLLIVSFYACVAVTTASLISSTQGLATDLPLVTACYVVFAAATFLLRENRRAVAAVLPAATAAYLEFVALTLSPTETGLVETAAGVALLLMAARAGARMALYASVAIGCFVFALPALLGWQWPSSLAWIALSVVLMLIGFRRALPFLRWSGLALIAIATLKIFIFDLARLAAINRVLALTLLGVALLAMSFVYQRNWLRQGPR